MFCFLLQWPTILTLAMFPVLVGMYVHLARQEERVRRPSSARSTIVMRRERRLGSLGLRDRVQPARRRECSIRFG